MLKKIRLFTANILFSVNTFALTNSTKISLIKEFVGGLNISQIEKCEKLYNKKCHTKQTWAQRSSCMENKMTHDNKCTEAYIIRKTTSYPASQMRQYDNNLVVFYTSSIADGQETYYIIDKKGELVELTHDEALVNKDPNYIILKKKYLDLAFTSFIFWKNEFKDLLPDTFPEFHLSSNSNLSQLVFKQELREHDCVGCKTVGVAYIAYQFNNNGTFINTKLLKVDILP